MGKKQLILKEMLQRVITTQLFHIPKTLTREGQKQDLNLPEKRLAHKGFLI